ncbi:acetyl-CoA carboxylase carboxyltransferase subunit alpha [Aquella oligotrophica]|uniref:Acetyl-coenzyme A carboxylase carboxyl transferase subunit alpha n=1 Tax=Aquella oligotrophica TaxID=2067065 RepID=A0A2I7N4S4_9NEIS|nr:acetyl-CoA carboxylase carboxyltransferase subunit alpha [Aquella oligotrophica]AUR51459.1 acetyl-CoA carboxylase carboxyl transferase subunit alpha [Aquella oligotrophica]
MKRHFLEFEKPIAELSNKIEELRKVQDDSSVNIESEIEQLQAKLVDLTKETYEKLGAWEISQVARHQQRPRTLDYIASLFTDFVELHGDRHFADDKSIIGGLAKFGEQSIMVIGHQKGRDTKENLERNFGMPRPEGYRKALRLMLLAEKFNIPIITFVDTPGAYPGIGAEERGQSEAIGKNLYEMANLSVPIICTVIGEGGSGGALAIAVGDQVNMLQYSIYSVISPEGCASILWKDATKANQAAEILGITADRLKGLGLIDSIINEPLGGAHSNHEEMMSKMKRSLKDHLKKLKELNKEQLIERRFERIMSYGKFKLENA